MTEFGFGCDAMLRAARGLACVKDFFFDRKKKHFLFAKTNFRMFRSLSHSDLLSCPSSVSTYTFEWFEAINSSFALTDDDDHDRQRKFLKDFPTIKKIFSPPVML